MKTKTTSSVAFALLLTAALAGHVEGALVDERCELRWKDEVHDVDRPPAELPEASRTAISDWADWASARGYTLSSSADGRVLLVVRAQGRKLKRLQELVERTAETVDRLLPVPEGRTRGDGPAPESPPAGPRPRRPHTWEWSNDGPPLDTVTAVLVQAASQDDYAAVIDAACTAQPYLEPWRRSGLQMSGFTLQRPLWAAWLESGEDLEEWSPENELVHRLAQLLALRRFDQVPYWLLMGFSWHVESELQGSIYCFPYRNEFVFAVEHTEWRNDLRRMFAEDRPFSFRALTEWRRGSYDPDAARMAWGAAGYIADEHAGKLAGVFEAFRLLRQERGIVHHPDGTWERVPDYQPTEEDQSLVLREHCGAAFLDEVREFCRRE